MLHVLSLVAQVCFLALLGYNVVVALWGWRNQRAAPTGSRRQVFRVVIPAHNEENVILGILGDLAAQSYARELVAVWVIADRCSDRTVELARALANVDQRSADDGRPGKADALAWHLERHPLCTGEAVVVLDADNRLGSDLLARFADELDAGHEVLQACLDVVNPDGSLVATASALNIWAANRMVQLARTNIGWAADLLGTGMCIKDSALIASGGFLPSLTEDKDLTARLLLAGVRPRWLHDVHIRDEMAEGFRTAVRQRSRWMIGKRTVAKQYSWPLVRRGVTRRDLASMDLAIRGIQPGRMTVVLVSAVLAVIAAMTRSSLLLPWPVWVAAIGVRILLPVAFLWRDGVPSRFVLRYPAAFVVPLLLSLPMRLLSYARAPTWYHTPHGQTKQPGRSGEADDEARMS